MDRKKNRINIAESLMENIQRLCSNMCGALITITKTNILSRDGWHNMMSQDLTVEQLQSVSIPTTFYKRFQVLVSSSEELLPPVSSATPAGRTSLSSAESIGREEMCILQGTDGNVARASFQSRRLFLPLLVWHRKKREREKKGKIEIKPETMQPHDLISTAGSMCCDPLD